MKCPRCGSNETRFDRSLAGAEICQRCSLNFNSRQKRPFTLRWISRKSKDRQLISTNVKKNFFSQSVGYFVVLSATVLGAAIPSISILDPKEFIAIANSNIPNGVPSGAFGSLTSEPIFQSIIRNGGQIILVNKLSDPNERHGDKGLGEIGGYWDPNTGSMKINNQADLGLQEFIDILNHEAIHMAQSCKAYSIKSEPVPIGLTITEEGLSRLDPYKESNPTYYSSLIEREAYSNDSYDSQRVVDVLDEQCGSKPWIPLFGNLRNLIQSFPLR